MKRRTYLRATGAGAVAGLAGCLGGGDANPNVPLSRPDHESDVSSEDFPYPTWGQQVSNVTLSDPTAGTEMLVHDIDMPHSHTYFLTNCMTVCPVLISAPRGAQIHSVSGGHADEVSFYPIMFDPVCDDADAFRAETDQMNVDMNADNWHFLRPVNESEVKSVVEDRFGVFFEKNEPDDEGNHMLTHLGLISLVNNDGYIEQTYRSNQPGKQSLIDDLTVLREAW